MDNECVHCGAELSELNFGCDLGWYGKECISCMDQMDALAKDPNRDKIQLFFTGKETDET